MDPGGAPPRRAQKAIPPNLPAVRTALFGRERDVDATVADLVDRPLVTLTGVGGIGKTRLALEVATRLQPLYRDGVWFARLDTVERPDALWGALRGLLGIERRGGDEVGSIVAGLRHREGVLLLDNCEHLLDRVTDLVLSVVESCPSVRVLATSRERLDVLGERVRHVRPLATDAGGPAIELFMTRAAEAGASIDPVRDADAVGRICRRLDGIPLAIELAATRTRSMRPHDLVDRLDEMLRLLTGGRRGAPQRHRTLRATLEWSHALLDEREQAVLARLSVFAGSFSLLAAEEVAGHGVRDVVDAIDRLVIRSLVVPEDGGDESRFRLLEPVRHLAAEKLAERGETDQVRRAHTQWYLELLHGLDVMWRNGDDQGAWPRALRDLPNLRAAFDALVDAGRVADAQRFAVAGYGPIACHVDPAPMYEWAPRAAALDPDYVGPSTASVCAIAAWGSMSQGDHAGASASLRRGVQAVQAGSRDDGLLVAAGVHLVLAGGRQGISNEFLAASVEAAVASGDLHRQAWALTYAGRFDEALDVAQRLGNRFLIAIAHSWVSALTPDDCDATREAFWNAAQRCHSYLMRNLAATERAFVHIRDGRPVDGLRLLQPVARDWLHRNDDRVWSVLHLMATGLAAAGDATGAAQLAGAVGERRLPFVSERRRVRLARLLDDQLGRDARREHDEAGRRMDAGAALEEATARANLLAACATQAPRQDDDVLTARQLEIAELVARGQTNKQIAQHLGISRFTAETHVRNILDRLGAATRSEVASWFASRTGSRGRT